MRKYWITAANAAGQVIYNQTVAAENLQQATNRTQAIVPSEHHGSICITDEFNNPIVEAAPGINIYTFSSTGDAYDACQCLEDIVKGDILIIPSEGVVGVADTWPFAVSERCGALHTCKDGWLDRAILGHVGLPEGWPQHMKRSITLALAIHRERLRAELLEACTGQSKDAWFPAWVEEMANSNNGTLQQTAIEYLKLAKPQDGDQVGTDTDGNAICYNAETGKNYNSGEPT